MVILRAINPIATIISSGDEEGYYHPRPVTLGIVGKTSRGERPLIFCSELSRSSKEYVEMTKSSLPKDTNFNSVMTMSWCDWSYKTLMSC